MLPNISSWDYDDCTGQGLQGIQNGYSISLSGYRDALFACQASDSDRSAVPHASTTEACEAISLCGIHEMFHDEVTSLFLVRFIVDSVEPVAFGVGLDMLGFLWCENNVL